MAGGQHESENGHGKNKVMESYFNNHEIQTILEALELLHEDYADECDVLINAIQNREAKKEYAVYRSKHRIYIDKLKKKVKDSHKKHSYVKTGIFNNIRGIIHSPFAS